MDTNNLKEFLVRYSTFEQAETGFKETIEYLRNQEPKIFKKKFRGNDIGEIKTERKQAALKIIFDFDEPVEIVQTTLNVYVQGTILVAEYHHLLDLDGAFIDDQLSYC